MIFFSKTEFNIKDLKHRENNIDFILMCFFFYKTLFKVIKMFYEIYIMERPDGNLMQLFFFGKVKLYNLP